MLFKDLKQNDNVYVLDKSSFEIKQGKIINNTFHTNTSYNNIFTNQQNILYRDITIEIDGKSSVYIIPENLDKTKAGNTLVIAISKSNLSDDIEECSKNAKEMLANKEYYEMVISKAPDLLAELNPSLLKERETEKRLDNIEKLVKSLVEKLS